MSPLPPDAIPPTPVILCLHAPALPLRLRPLDGRRQPDALLEPAQIRRARSVGRVRVGDEPGRRRSGLAARARRDLAPGEAGARRPGPARRRRLPCLRALRLDGAAQPGGAPAAPRLEPG